MPPRPGGCALTCGIKAEHEENPWSVDDVGRLMSLTSEYEGDIIDWIEISRYFPGVEPVRVRWAWIAEGRRQATLPFSPRGGWL